MTDWHDPAFRKTLRRSLDWARADQAQRAHARHLLPLVLRPPPSLDFTKELSETSEIEKVFLCAWRLCAISLSTQALTGWPWTRNPGARLAPNPDRGWAFAFQDLHQCENRLPELKCTLGEALDSFGLVYRGIAKGKRTRPRGCWFGIDVVTTSTGRSPKAQQHSLVE